MTDGIQALFFAPPAVPARADAHMADFILVDPRNHLVAGRMDSRETGQEFRRHIQAPGL